MKAHSRIYRNMQDHHLLACLAEVIPQVPDGILEQIRLFWSRQHDHQLFFSANKDQLTKAEKQFLDLFDKAYNRFYSARAQWQTSEPSGLPLTRGLLRLFCNDQNPAALPLEGQHLLVGAPGEALPLVYYLLCRHASHTQLAFFKAKDCLQVVFHIKDDIARHSSFSDVLEDPLLKGFAHMVAYQVHHHILFLPQRPRNEKDQAYSMLGLEQFARIATHKPELFQVDPQASQWLGAMISREHDKTLVWLPLTGLTFRNQLEVMPPESLNAEVIEPDPAEEALESFKQELRKNHHAHYRLSLLPIPNPHHRQSLYERMLNQKEKLDYELALLEDSQAATGLLLRYEHEDFPILATYLRSLSKNKNALFNGQIRYCFQGARCSIDGQRRPLHYLWVAAELVGRSYDPSLLFEPIGAQTSVFQLDPFWVRSYSEHASSYLFVPRGTTLYPPIHPFDVDQIDSYMAHLLLGYASEPVDAPAQRPMYVFEALKEGKLKVTVLDGKAFQAPCMTMGWLNDCAVVTNQDLRTEISASARDMTYLHLSAYLEPVGARARKTFEQAARDANASLKVDCQDLFAEMAREMEALLLQAAGQAKRILRLAPRLKRFTGLAGQHIASYKIAVKSYFQLRKEARDLSARAVSADRLVAVKLAQAQDRADKFADGIDRAIKRLKSSRNHVLSRAKSLLNPFNRNK